MESLPDITTQFKTPGQLIEHFLSLRNWSKRVLAIILGMDESTLNKVVAAHRAVDAKMALGLSELFGVPAEKFMDLQKSWDLTQARLLATPDPDRTNRAHLFGSLPIAEMMKRGWIQAKNIKNAPEVEAAAIKFFGVESADQIEIMPHAAKKTVVTGDVTPVQMAWLYRVKQIAEDMLVPRYSPEAVRAVLPKLKALLQSAEEARHVPRILEECGIRFVIVETLPGAKIDGVCFWLDDESPVIGMTFRFDRIDNFWFVLRHEIEHVLQLHGKESIPLDVELEGERAGIGSDVNEEERVANEAAAEFCVPRKSLKLLIDRKAPFFAERDILGFARSLQIHPGLVAGQLQRHLGKYDRFKAHLAKLRSIVLPSAAVDGWGDIYPLEY